ncbi:MAG TPA: hypothetical protein VEA59_05750, partial [Patescibacteria group bacterium]|nr:hypothetical protein [Patescibacteria group bacterium]
LVSAIKELPGTWLPNYRQGTQTLGGTPILDITLNTLDSSPDEIRYEIVEGAAHILVTAKQGSFSPEDVTVKIRNQAPDAIILVGCPNFEALEHVFTQNTDTFYNTPKINLDNSPQNEHFGNINFVQIASASVSELALQLIKQLGASLSPEMATQLLAGIISATYSFQEPNTTPESLLTSADLVNAGADQQLIIRNLYKTKKLKVLKLWGRVLARIKTLDENGVMYSVLSSQDLERSEADHADIIEAIKESLDNISDYKVVAVIAEAHDVLTLTLAVRSSSNLDEMCAAWDRKAGEVIKHRDFCITQIDISDLNVQAAEEKFLQTVQGSK